MRGVRRRDAAPELKVLALRVHPCFNPTCTHQEIKVDRTSIQSLTSLSCFKYRICGFYLRVPLCSKQWCARTGAAFSLYVSYPKSVGLEMEFLCGEMICLGGLHWISLQMHHTKKVKPKGRNYIKQLPLLRFMRFLYKAECIEVHYWDIRCKNYFKVTLFYGELPIMLLQ
jgi:hypothetical protein